LKQIRVRLLEFGQILQDIHSEVNPYDIIRDIKYIIQDTYNPDWNEFEHKRKLISNIKDWVREEDFNLLGIELVDIVDNYLVLNIPNDLGKQHDMFGKDSILSILQNAGLR